MTKKLNDKDLTGKRFGRIVIENIHRTVNPSTGQLNLIICHCICDCGKRKLIRWYNLQNGGTTSCGCYQAESAKIRNATHGQARHSKETKQSPTYRSWAAMVQRCVNPRCKDYKNYGGRGITIPEKWKSFDQFFKDMGHRPEATTLGRLDNDLPYSKENCEWQDIKKQNRNMKTTQWIMLDGQQHCLGELAEKYGIKYTTLHRRLKSGWTPSKAIHTPIETKHLKNKKREPRMRRLPLSRGRM